MDIRALSFVVLFGVSYLNAAENNRYPDAVCVELHGSPGGCVKIYPGAINPITGWFHDLTCSGKLRSVFKSEDGTVLGTQEHGLVWSNINNLQKHLRSLLGKKPTAASAAVHDEEMQGRIIRLFNAFGDHIDRSILSGQALPKPGEPIPDEVIKIFMNKVANSYEQLAKMRLSATPPAQSLLRNPTVIACCAAAAAGAAWLAWNRLSKKSSEDSSQ